MYNELEKSIGAAIQTYSNVHRGSGHFSQATTRLYEEAREIVRLYLGVGKDHTVIFGSLARMEALTALLPAGSWRQVSGRDIGLPLGVTAVAVRKNALPRGVPIETGGGTARLTGDGWVVWDSVPSRFEAGTPAIVNCIALARALQLLLKTGRQTFPAPDPEPLTAEDILFRDDIGPLSGKALMEALRHRQSGRNILVPTHGGNQPYIHLDNSASTPTFGPIAGAFIQSMRQPEIVREEIVGRVRTVVASMLGAPETTWDVLFTSNTTEAINAVAAAMPAETDPGIRPVILTTMLEHTSNDLPWRTVPGYSLARLPVDKEGFFDLAGLDDFLASYNRDGKRGNERIRLVTLSAASNVLGSYNDLEEISRIVHRHGALLMVDAAQWVAHRKVEMERTGIDFLTFSAHKVYAPFGSGALIFRKGTLDPQAAGLLRIRRNETENAPGIAALGKALELLRRIGMETVREEEEALTRRLLEGMKLIPGIRIFGIGDTASPRFDRKGGVVAFDLKGTLPGKLAGALARRGGIGVRYGCHCSHMLVKYLHGITPGLERFQAFLVRIIPAINLPGVVRVSLGIGNTEQDVDAFLKELAAIAGKKKNPETWIPEARVKKEIGIFVERVRGEVFG